MKHRSGFIVGKGNFLLPKGARAVSRWIKKDKEEREYHRADLNKALIQIK